MSHMQDGAGRHRSRAHRPTRTSSEAHRSDWDRDPEDAFEHAPKPHRDRRRSHNHLPDEPRNKQNYYPPNASTRQRRASDVPPIRSTRDMPPPPQSVGTRTGRSTAVRRNRAHTGSSRAPSLPRPVMEESDDSSEEDSDEDSDSDDDDRAPRSRAVSKARSVLKRGMIRSRANSASSDSLSIEALMQPRTPAARSRATSRVSLRVPSRGPSRAVSRVASRAASRARSSRPSSPTDSDADVDSDTPSEASSESSKRPRRRKGVAPPKPQKQKRIQAAPVNTNSELVRVQPTPAKPKPKIAHDFDDSGSEDATSSSSDGPKIDMTKLRKRHSPAKTQVAKRMSPHREHRRHHSDPKRPSRREHDTPERKPGMRRTQRSPHSRVYNSSQGSVYHVNHSHTAPSSYVTSRSAPTRRSSSTRRSSPWLVPGHTPGRPRSRPRHEILPCEKCETIDESSVALKCGHFMCTECLKDCFRDAITNPSRARPACPCGQQISVRRVGPMLPAKLKTRWNRNFAGQAIQQRFCCPFQNCAVWIPRWQPDLPDGTVQCPQCIIHICRKCNLKTPPNVKSHKCSRDEKTRKKLDHARENPKWKCAKCKTYTEASEEGKPFLACGDCGYEVCAACQHPRATKLCHCPWFESGAEDQPQVVQRPPRVPMPQEPQIMTIPELVQPSRQRRPSSSGRTTRSRGSHQHHEEHRRRRKHEREEMLLTHETLYDEPELEGDDMIEVYGNAAGHYINEDYRRGHEGLAAPPSPPQHHPGMPFDRVDGDANYVSGVNRARGVNGRGSIERLAERFSERGPGGSPGHRALSIPNPTNTPRTMAPRSTIPQPSAAPPPNLRRYHTVDDDLSSPRMQQVERVPTRRFTNDFVEDNLDFPSPSSRSSRSQQSRRHKEDYPYSSSVPTDAHTNGILAGLSGRDSGMGRVHEWRQYIENGDTMPVQG